MIPDLQSSLICDDVRQERNGKFMLIGLFDAIHAESLPMTFAKMCLVTRWCSGEGVFTQRSRIIHPDQQTVLATGKDVQVKLPSPEAAATSVEVFMNIVFPTTGTYWVEIMLEDDMKIRYPLRVNQLERRPAKQ
ncbi:DUF6941 family protein [Tichowtungia aerotolerans]|uniref:DUF4469 domain-containing protein n=1 Tax=Tichowtungia aerotolerans TaxID=2697043 RepID=A0A6P1M3P6_9BACT|nr:hypothetical protein [Tichowtungia aerotolerans]QHI68451.1 hypothetical protein GT409_02945 [Tichowtungia aerotolerans]